MLVRNRMTRNPVTIGPRDTLARADEKMAAGGFRRLPVVEGGALVGILTDRDLRRRKASLKTTRVAAAMTERPLTVSPETTVERAADLMIRHKISGLPVLDGGRLVGMITTTDILRAFLEVMGAEAEGTVRIDLVNEEGRDLTLATGVVRAQGGEVLSVGVYRDAWGDQPVFYLRLRGAEPEALAAVLERRGFTVLGIHP